VADSPFIARPADVTFICDNFAAAAAGTGRTLILPGRPGAGRRAIIGEAIKTFSADDTDALVWRVALTDEEDGLRSILRLYATLLGTMHRDPMLKGRVELLLGAQLPQHGKRVQGWFKGFIDALKRSAPKSNEESFQVSLPRDNPVAGLVAVITAIASKMPVVLDLQNVSANHSLSVWALIEALVTTGAKGKLLTILHVDPLTDENRAYLPAPLLDLMERRGEDLTIHTVAPWGSEEVATFLASKDLQGNADDLAATCQGLPGYLVELVALEGDSDFSADFSADFSGKSLASLYPRAVDEEELEEKTLEGKRVATADDLEEIAFRASLLGRAFPSGLVADIGGFDRDSVDDLLDAAGDLFSELQFSDNLGTWIYQFNKAIWRQGAEDHYLANEDRAEQGKTIGRQTATFLQRVLVPRSYDFVHKSARLAAQVGLTQQAGQLRSMAMSGDRPEIWAWTHDLLTLHPDVSWPDPMRRTVYMNLLSRMVEQGDVGQAERLFNECIEWAQSHEDRRMQAFVLGAGSKLDARRQDFYRARDRAGDALTIYKALEDGLQQAEILNHLALIELSDGNPTAASEKVTQALQAGVIETADGRKAVMPQVAANAEFIRGQVDRRAGKFKSAGEHFRLSNEIAGRAGISALALESGLAYGECLLRNKQSAKAADVLERVVGIARGVKQPVRERGACALLSQAHADQRNFEAALKWGKRALELTRQLKFDKLEPMDLYNLGLFTLMLNKPTEALALLKDSRSKANLVQDVMFAKELLYHLGVAAQQTGETELAVQSFTQALAVATQAKDGRKVLGCHKFLGELAQAKGDNDVATEHFQKALAAAETANLKEERKAIRKQLEGLR
jgi:tetratricopeptide (TPR) repeat protein